MTLNIMMDGKPILPDMFHPAARQKTRDFKGWIRPYTRTARPVRYYWTDFGLSRRYAPDDLNPLEVPIIGGDRSVPEFMKDPYTPCNPFRTDVYYVGNLIREDFLQVGGPYSHLWLVCPADASYPGIQKPHIHGSSNRSHGSRRTGETPHHGRSRPRVQGALIETQWVPIESAIGQAPRRLHLESCEKRSSLIRPYYTPPRYPTLSSPYTWTIASPGQTGIWQSTLPLLART